jgi:ureidoacrylate peracid hydrolase
LARVEKELQEVMLEFGGRMLTRRRLLGTFAMAGMAGMANRVSGTAAKPRPDLHPGVPSRTVQIDAKPGPVEIDLSRTAVIVVDMQNDFGSKGGMFDRAGIDISPIQKTIPPTAETLAAARRSGLKIFYLKMGFRADLSDLGSRESVNRTRHLQMHVGTKIAAPNGKEGRILIRDTWNTDIVDELTPCKGDVIVYKTRFSGFYKTNLDDLLRSSGVENLIVTGCTTSVCVDSTIRDAMFRDYRCILLSDCAAEPIGNGIARSNHEASLLTVEVLLGWVSDSGRFLKAVA